MRGDADEPGLRGLSIYTEGSLPTKFTTQGFIQLGETVRVSGSLASQPTLILSADRFQYRHEDKWSGDLGSIHVNPWNAITE